MSRFTREAFLLLVFTACVPALAHAQASIAGVVRDPSGAVLPGVTVEASSPALIEKVRTVVTDGSGQYRIIELRPGTYAVTFTLSGFSTVRREGIELTGSFVATIDADLRVGALEETITVTGDSPIVDIQRTTQQRVFDAATVEAIPVGRSHINMAVLVPGLVAAQPGRGALADVGGTNNLQNTTFAIHGGRTSDTRLQLDGVRLGNVLSPGEFSNFVPDTGATQEVTIDYGAISAEQPFGGLRIDLIPREGGNSVRGTVFATGVNSAWQGSNLTQELEDRGLPEPNEMKRAYDINPSVGGPLLRDRLWFYSSARWQVNQNYIAGLYYNANAGDPTQWLYQQDTSQRGFFSLEQNGVNTRLTWQAAPKHKVGFYYDNQSRIWDDTRANVSPESAVAYRFPVLNLAQASWTAPMTNRLLFEARYARRGEAFGNQLPEAGSIYRDLIPVLEQSTGMFYRGKGGDGGSGVRSDRARSAARRRACGMDRAWAQFHWHDCLRGGVSGVPEPYRARLHNRFDARGHHCRAFVDLRTRADAGWRASGGGFGLARARRQLVSHVQPHRRLCGGDACAWLLAGRSRGHGRRGSHPGDFLGQCFVRRRAGGAMGVSGASTLKARAENPAFFLFHGDAAVICCGRAEQRRQL
jgi:hypothetical protein